jgi:hypothetical protein
LEISPEIHTSGTLITKMSRTKRFSSVTLTVGSPNKVGVKGMSYPLI